jgi:hypothetical protein
MILSYKIFLVGPDVEKHLCSIPNDAELRRDILVKAHQTRYIVHLGNNKMCQDLKKKFWWCDMKRNLAEYVAQCPSCQLVKAEHQRSAGQHYPLEVPTSKCEQISMDFVVGLPKHQADKMPYG